MAIRKVNHKWTTYDREVLYLLKVKHSRKFIAPVFNYLLSSRLIKEGFKHGMTAPSLDVQWQEMKTGGCGHEIYARMSNLLEHEVEKNYQNILNEIEAATRTLRLKVQPSSRIAKPPTKAKQNKFLKKVRCPRRIQESGLSDASAESEPIQSFVRSSLQQYINRSPYFPGQEPANVNSRSLELGTTFDNNDTVPPTPVIHTDSHGLPAKKRPLLLFRSTNSVNAFRSRRYVDADRFVPPPAKSKSKAYMHDAWPHLQRDKEYRSPFLSFGQKASNVIGRLEIARSEDFDVKKFLAVFAFNDIEADAALNFGTGSGPYLVRGLFTDDEISTLPKGYKGGGEWLVWGYISCKPIVVLDSYQTITLAEAIRKFKTGDIAALADISKSLQDVPIKWKEAVSYIILKSYCSKKLPAVGTPAYREMIDLIISGRRVTSMAEPIDISRLSVVDEVSSDSDDDDTEETFPPHQRLPPGQIDPRTVQPMQTTVPAGSFGTSTARVNSVIGNLNLLGSRSALEELPQNVVEATPFWSPDPPEDINAELERSQPTQDRVPILPLHETIDLNDEDEEEEDEDEDDWELINADLEQSFLNSYPSASKKAETFQTAKLSQASSDVDFDDDDDDDEEDQDFPIPSIEKDKPCNDENSHRRENFLRGLTQFAVSVSPPILDTPTRMPPQATSVRTVKPSGDGAPFSIKDQQPTARTPKFQPYQAYAIAKPARVQNVVSERPGLAKIMPANNNGGKGTTTNSNTNASNSNPGTSIRTKVPVIVRKKIVDW